MMGHHPEGGDALVYFAKLPRAGDDAATIDDGLQAIGGAVFFDQLFSGVFGKPIQRARSG